MRGVGGGVWEWGAPGRPEADPPAGRWVRPAGAGAAAAAASGWAVRIFFPPPPRPSRPRAQSLAPAAQLRARSPLPPAAPSPFVHVPACGAPGLLLPGGRALRRAAGRGPGRRGRRRPGAAAAPTTAALAPGCAAAPGAASLRGYRRRGAGRAACTLFPPGRRRGRGSGLRAAARSPAVVARSAAADSGLLHGGTQLWGTVAEQLPAGEELVPVLGRLLGECRARAPRSPREQGSRAGSLLCLVIERPRAALGEENLSDRSKFLGR